ncbi:hypothetical protein SAMD00079811_69690 [Scytonema sp. HK-05]|nr:hypothetical protein NIES2130_14050 [Scytonema sp. HK-05]BAY49340.1 hypothetical protein SAMD00079811_69690 [Scytonema sp. HK-05]
MRSLTTFEGLRSKAISTIVWGKAQVKLNQTQNLEGTVTVFLPGQQMFSRGVNSGTIKLELFLKCLMHRALE